MSTSIDQEEGLLLCHFGPYNKKPGHYWLEYVSYVIGEHQPLVVENISSERKTHCAICQFFGSPSHIEQLPQLIILSRVSVHGVATT